jgi:hypothetical protein
MARVLEGNWPHSPFASASDEAMNCFYLLMHCGKAFALSKDADFRVEEFEY